MSQLADETHVPLGSMSLDEWAALDEDVEGELEDGLLVEDEMAGIGHELIVAWLIQLLRNWAVQTRALVVGSDAKFAVSSRRGRKPDVAVYFAGTRRPPRNGVVRVAPDLMIEVISPDRRHERRDRVEKLAEYAVFGVRYYWIIDPERRTLEMYARTTRARYKRIAIGGDAVIAEVPGLDGIVLDLPALWTELDSLPEE